MHNKTIPLLLSISMFLMTISCMRQLSEAAQTESPVRKDDNENFPHFVNTKSLLGEPEDSLSRLIFCQQDPDMRMLNQIIRVDGEYVLAITAEEAQVLGIPEEIYTKYVQYVGALNNKD